MVAIIAGTAAGIVFTKLIGGRKDPDPGTDVIPGGEDTSDGSLGSPN